MTRQTVDAFAFEDFIDGYFPLTLSLRHLIDRLQVEAAFVVLRVAPMMDLPGLNPEDPVPLHIDPAQAGQINWMAVTARRTAVATVISGHALWTWNASESQSSPFLPPTIRLTEPVFVRGIGFRGGSHDFKSLGPIAVAKEDHGISISSQTLLRFVADAQSEEISWPMTDGGTVVRLPEIKENVPSTLSSKTLKDCLVLSKKISPVIERFVSDLLTAVK